MEPFTFLRFTDSRETITGMMRSGVKVLAGGTNLVDLMKLGIERPKTLIDIQALPLASIKRLTNGNLSIGALTSNSALAYHSEVIESFPVLSEALLSGASPQLRNRATVGGNLLQRTRCLYFYNTDFPCNKRLPGSGCPAIKGYNRNNAVLGTSDHCIAANPSDMCVALAALDAIVHLQGPKGTRSVPLEHFHLLPGDTPHLETVLQTGELIVSVELPPLPDGSRSHYLKVRDRASYEFALTSAAVALTIEKGRIRSARIALGGVGTKPWRARSAEQVIQGAVAGDKAWQLAASTALKEAKGFKYNAFKIGLAKRTLVRALSTAGGTT